MQYRIETALYFKTTVLAAALKQDLAAGDTLKTPRDDRVRLRTQRIDKFEIPAFEAGSAAVQRVLEVEVFWTPDIFYSPEHTASALSLVNCRKFRQYSLNNPGAEMVDN